MMDYAKNFDKDDEDSLYNQLMIEYNLAKADYIRKKRLKGEIVDEDKMQNAINQRKKIRGLCNKCLHVTLGRGFNFLKETKEEKLTQ